MSILFNTIVRLQSFSFRSCFAPFVGCSLKSKISINVETRWGTIHANDLRTAFCYYKAIYLGQLLLWKQVNQITHSKDWRQNIKQAAAECICNERSIFQIRNTKTHGPFKPHFQIERGNPVSVFRIDEFKCGSWLTCWLGWMSLTDQSQNLILFLIQSNASI